MIIFAAFRGGEIQLKGEFLRNLLSRMLSYTYIDPQDLDFKKMLPYRPRHQVIKAISLDCGAFQIGGDFHYRSRCRSAVAWLERDERVAHYVLNVNGSMKLSNQFALQGQIDNLLQYHYTEVPRRLAPIRNCSLTLAAKL